MHDVVAPSPRAGADSGADSTPGSRARVGRSLGRDPVAHRRTGARAEIEPQERGSLGDERRRSLGLGMVIVVVVVVVRERRIMRPRVV